jgi:hypothetical protein
LQKLQIDRKYEAFFANNKPEQPPGGPWAVTPAMTAFLAAWINYEWALCDGRFDLSSNQSHQIPKS